MFGKMKIQLDSDQDRKTKSVKFKERVATQQGKPGLGLSLKSRLLHSQREKTPSLWREAINIPSTLSALDQP